MEDVNYLRRFATEESFLFVADSSKRDTTVYQEPHTYEVAFNSPFRHVVGLDLIDATLPRTEYLVEHGSNTLAYTRGTERHVATVEPGDYNVLQLVEALNAALAPRLTVQPTTTPAEISNTVRFLGDAPFQVHPAQSGLRRALGLGHRTLASSPVPGGFGSRRVVEGPLPAGDTVAMALVRQPFVCPADGTFAAVSVAVSSSEATEVRVVLLNGAGDVVAQGLAVTGGVDFEQLDIGLTEALSVSSGEACAVVLSSTARVYSAGPDVSVGEPGEGEGDPWWAAAEWTDGADGLCLDATMAVDAHVVQPPGVVDLTGEAYVLIRCDEIETQLYRNRAYETVHAGMGLVKLGIYGFREQRFDFVSFPPRKLPTPITLTKLTLHLQKRDGTPYDTKGVDHHLVFVVRYLEITQGPRKDAQDPTPQNPGYVPNPLHALQKQPLSFHR